MAQRQSLRVSRSLEGEGERQARGIGWHAAGAQPLVNVWRRDMGSPKPARMN